MINQVKHKYNGYKICNVIEEPILFPEKVEKYINEIVNSNSSKAEDLKLYLKEESKKWYVLKNGNNQTIIVNGLNLDIEGHLKKFLHRN